LQNSRPHPHEGASGSKSGATAEVRLDAVGAAVQPGQPRASNASCGRRALLPIAQVVRKGDPGLNSPEIWRMSDNTYREATRHAIAAALKITVW